MQLHYKLTFKDFLDAQALHAKRSSRAFFLYALSRYLYPALGLCFLLFLLLSTKPLHAFFTAPGNRWGLFSCGILLSCPIIVRWSLKRSYTRTRTGSGDCTIDFDPDLIHTRMEHVKSEIEWPAIKGFAEDKSVFLLYVAEGKFFVIPKRVCAREEIDRLRVLFSTQIQPHSWNS